VGAGTWAAVGEVVGPSATGLGPVNNFFSELNRIVSKGLELIRSKDALPMLKQISNKIWL
jgi:hypothetical protein